MGHRFVGYFGWHYPPTFLFVAAGLSLLPYGTAYALCVFGTFPNLSYGRSRHCRRPYRLFPGSSLFSAVLANFIVGQNGFLTAALTGGALTLLQRRPIVAGALFGLLTYKPHLALLFPLALFAGWPLARARDHEPRRRYVKSQLGLAAALIVLALALRQFPIAQTRQLGNP